MKKETYIYIQEPCHENWNGMTSAKQGRYCHSCSKTVTDFSGMSDTEILKYLAAAGNTCGRFTPDQLTRSIHEPASPARKTFWAYLLSMFLPVMMAERLSAQKRVSAKAKTEQTTTGKPAKLQQFLNVDCEEIPADTTKLPNTGGQIPVDSLNGNIIYKPVVMGLLIQYDKVKTKDTITAVVAKATGNELFSTYPGRALKGKKVSIKVNEAGEYVMHFMDVESKMIVFKNVSVTTKGQIVFLDIPEGIASGNYYLRLIQAGSNKQFVDKLEVQ